jgi:Domain of unknown function (DUF6916)
MGMNEMRRHLLRLASLTAASVILPLELLAQSAGNAAPTSAPQDGEYDALSYLTAADFKPFVGAVFKIQSPTGSVRVSLAQVQSPPTLPKATQGATAKATPQTFALRFMNISGGPLTQGTYVFRNSSLVPFAMFIVPSAKGAKPIYYTGQVNRSVQ